MAKKDAAAASNKPETTKVEKPPAAKAAAAMAPAAKAEEKKPKNKKKAGKDEPEESPVFLHQIRPRARVFFFPLFVAVCVGVVAFHSPCSVSGKKRDCGFEGISPLQCVTSGCFLKGGGGTLKKTLKVKREEGTLLGLELSGTTVSAISAGGAVQVYNQQLEADSESIIRPGDEIVKLDGSTGDANIGKAAAKKKKATVEIVIHRSRLPSFLSFVKSEDPAKPGVLERMLTSPGSLAFGSTWSYFARIGVATWFISGYPLASLPTYLMLSAGVSFQLNRCCHDEQVGAGVPHCFKPNREPTQAVLEKVFGQVKELTTKVAADPKSYLKHYFVSDKKYLKELGLPVDF